MSHWAIVSSLFFCVLCAFSASAADPKFADVPPSLLSGTNSQPSTLNPQLSGGSQPSTLNSQLSAATNSQLSTLNSQLPPGTNSMDALDDKHMLAIGDRLSFRIEEDEEDPKSLFVTDSGDLEVPYIGRFPAANKTCKALALELKAALEKEYYYQATVIIAVDLKAKSRGRIYIDGPVRVPGFQELPSDETLTLSKAILRAGGFTDYADRKNVKITRDKPAPATGVDTIVVDVSRILEKGRTELDVPLQPGDLIHIPERLFKL